MKRAELLKEISSGVFNEMYEAIDSRCDWVNYEKRYGKALVIVDVCLVSLPNGMLYDDVMVQVQHDDDDERQSPLLEQAIKGALPQWFNVKEYIRQQVA
jgi:hypothetical protein